MRIYIIEYRYLLDKEHGIWTSKIMQEGFKTLERAQAFIESRASMPYKCREFYYQARNFDEYYIHDILVC